MRLAYADPPYPGKAHLYPENTEVDHAALIARLSEYDGWALSTDEPALVQVLILCPRSTRVLAWCKTDSPPRMPYPWFSHEFVLCKPARVSEHAVRSYHVGPAPPRGFCGPGSSLIGAKSPAFCEWVIRCLGATREDALDDVFPGSGVMGRAWEAFVTQPELRAPEGPRSWGGTRNMRRRTHDPIPGLEGPGYAAESWK